MQLSAPAPPGGVTFSIFTADNTADVGLDYDFHSLTGQTIPAGSTTYTFDVTVNGDAAVEGNETFFVNVTNIVGASIGDAQGVGTITNDDVLITPIHDIQGPGASSPMHGSIVTIRGIVTGVTSNGFFVQEEDADLDADPATSEGIFVFTPGAPPAAASFTALVEVTGMVLELVPVNDPQDPPSTQLTSPTVVQLAAPGQPLPTATPLSTTFPDPAGPADQLERVEHMRVSVASLTVSGPSGGSIDESTATGTSDGRFHGVVTGLPRPFREAGIQPPDVPPSGSIPPIPRWDFNPERIRIESAALTGQPVLTVQSGDIVGPLVGPLDYRARGYVLLPDGTSTPVITPGTLSTTVSSPAGNEITVASVNLRRFFDTTDDPAYAEPVLSPAAYDSRLAKASIAIRDHLRSPDIIGVQDVETLGVLSDLAARILSDGGANYVPYLMEGNDAIGLDVGLLVKTNPVTGGVARVSMTSVTQIGVSAQWTNPSTGALELLNDRPPLVLQATVNRASTASFPLVVIVTDLVGLTGVDSHALSGLTTLGGHVRQKRQAQAEFLANHVQNRLTAAPGEQLVVIGSFNAFEMNDGYVDVVNVVAGTPPPDNQTVVPGDGADLVNPDLVNLVSTPPAAERYSDVFEGNARNLDHALVSSGLVGTTTARRIEHPRIGADYPETHLGDDATALRFSDRDPVVAYFAADTLNLTDLQVTNVDTPDPVTAGQNLTYTMTVTNSGPDSAASVSLSDTPPAGTTFVSLSSPGGWSCTTPAVGEGGTISCSNALVSMGSAVFTLTVAVAPSVASGTLSNTVNVSSSTADATPGDNSAVALTTVNGAPTMTDITDQTIVEDGTAVLPFTIGDVETPAASLMLSVTSSDQTLVPDASMVVGGSDASRVLTVTPAANRSGGPVIITVTVSDGTLSSSDTFAVTVTPVNDVPTITPIAPQSVPKDTPLAPVAFTVGDEDNVVSTLTVTATSSNQALVPDANLAIGGSGAMRTIAATPAAGQTGTATITVAVDDGTANTVTTFVLTVDQTDSPVRTYYLAEGATGPFFDTDILLVNPNPLPAPVRITFLLENGTSVVDSRTLPATSRATIAVDELEGLDAATFSTIVTSTEGHPIAVERTMRWDASGYGAHTEKAVEGAATTWYFAEGSQGFFSTFLLLANPQPVTNVAHVTWLREGEPPLERSYDLAPGSRGTIDIGLDADLRDRAFGARVTFDQPGIAERAMYFGTDPQWLGGHAAAGATTLSNQWFLAEGATGDYFTTFVLLANPNDSPADVTLTYLTEAGTPVTATGTIPAGQRMTRNIALEHPSLAAASVATEVTSTQPIVVERAQYWGQPTWVESHDSLGVTTPGHRWALAEGRVGGQDGAQTYILLANPGSTDATVTLTFLRTDGTTVAKTVAVPAERRVTIGIHGADSLVPELADETFGTLIESTAPIVVERSLYSNADGLFWAAGTNATATALPQPQ